MSGKITHWTHSPLDPRVTHLVGVEILRRREWEDKTITGHSFVFGVSLNDGEADRYRDEVLQVVTSGDMLVAGGVVYNFAEIPFASVDVKIRKKEGTE